MLSPSVFIKAEGHALYEKVSAPLGVALLVEGGNHGFDFVLEHVAGLLGERFPH